MPERFRSLREPARMLLSNLLIYGLHYRYFLDIRIKIPIIKIIIDKNCDIIIILIFTLILNIKPNILKLK